VLPPLLAHAPPKLLAKQWLQAYQRGPAFVPPLILSGATSNFYLAYTARSTDLRVLYTAAALMTFCIMPVTLLYFEPGINGAAKWKIQRILADGERDAGYKMAENRGIMPRVDRQTGTLEARRWAEGMELRDIVERWGSLNTGRWIVTALAGLISAGATCSLGVSWP
jgi:hypothetical protein